MSEADPAGAIDPWAVLGIAPTRDPIEVRRAYTRKLKTIDPEEDPDSFMLLRSARDWAMDVGIHGDPADHSPSADLPVDEPIAQEPSPVGMAPDEAAIARLHAMVFDPAQPATFEQVEEQTRVVLADPAMVQVDHLAAMENFFARLIVEGTPRSDGAVALAIEQFGWRKDGGRIDRPPVIDWIVQRQDDIYFERGLPDRGDIYARALATLRSPLPEKRSRWTAWLHGPRIEFLLDYLQQWHPTTIDGLDRATVDWWVNEIRRFRQLPPPVRQIYARRYNQLVRLGIGKMYMDIDPLLIFAILLWPWAAVWALLLGTYSRKARLIGFSWLAVQLSVVGGGGVDFLFFALGKLTSASQQAPSDGAPVVPPSPAMPVKPYTSYLADVGLPLLNMTSGSVDLATLRSSAPALHAAIEADWREYKRAGKPITDFHQRLFDRLRETLRLGLATGDPAIILDFARAYDAKLRWATRMDPDKCLDPSSGKERGYGEDAFIDYRGRLIGRIIKGGMATTRLPPPDDKKVSANFTIPPALYADAERRSTLAPAVFAKALSGKGKAIDRCNAQIALIDAGIVGGKPGIDLLRTMFGVER